MRAHSITTCNLIMSSKEIRQFDSIHGSQNIRTSQQLTFHFTNIYEVKIKQIEQKNNQNTSCNSASAPVQKMLLTDRLKTTLEISTYFKMERINAQSQSHT
eukprot:c15852_g1_i1 orf=280-582(+)